MRQLIGGWVGKPVIVTGASGFIGTALSNRLQTLGADVHRTTRSVATPGRRTGWHTVDLGDSEAVDNLLTVVKPHAIFHLAGLVTGSRDLDAVLPTLQANLVCTINLLTSATRHQARVVIAGSLEEPTTHELAEGASSPYSMAKWATTEYAALFEHLYCTAITVLRIGMAYGPGEQARSRLVPYVIDSFLSGTPPELTSGLRRVDWVYIDDVVDALVAAAERNRPGVGPFDVGSGESISIRTTVELIAELLHSPVLPAFGAREDRPMDRDRVADLAPISAVLDWKPRTSLTEGLSATIDWHRRKLG